MDKMKFLFPYEFLADALELLYNDGIDACLTRHPALEGQRAMLLVMSFQEDRLTAAEVELQQAAEALQVMEENLIQRLTLQGYNPPRQVPRWVSPAHDLWTWLTWQRRRMRSLLTTTTPPPSPSTISDCSSRLGD